MDFLLELTIIAIFLLFTLTIGFCHARGIKTLSDYVIGVGGYSTPVLLATLLATFIGGNTLFGGIEGGISYGIKNSVLLLGSAVASFIIGKWIAPRMERFKGKISLGEILETAYGKHGQIIGGLLGLLLCNFFVAVQVIAIGFIFENFLNISPFWAIILAGGTLVLYSTFGGIKSITWTDIFQFGFLIIIIPFLFNLALDHLGGFHVLFESLPKSHITFLPPKAFFIQDLNFFIICCVPYLYPPIIQRIFMAKNARQARTMFYTMGVVLIPLYILIGGIGLIAFALNPELSPDQALPYLINNTIPFWFKQLVLLGFLAAIMSTADSFLNSGSVALVRDIIKPIFGTKYNFSEARELKWARVATLLIGSFAIVVALGYLGTFFAMVQMSLLLWIPTIIVPLIGTILGLKATKRGFFLSVFGGGITAIVWSIWMKPIVGIDGQLPGVLVNAGIFSISCLLNRKAWKLERNPIGNYGALGAFLKELRDNAGMYVPNFKNMLRFAQERADLCPPQYFVFGVFIIANFSVPYFMWSFDLAHSNVAILFRLLGAGLCVVLLLKNYISEKLQKYFPLYWQLTVMFCLPFNTTYLLFDSGGSSWWLINTALSLTFGVIMLDWLSFILINFVGILLGWGFYACVYGFERIDLDPLVLYMWGFSFVIGIVFSRVRDVAQLRIQVKKLEALAGSIAHEMRTPLVSANLGAEGLKQFLPDFVKAHQEAQEKGLTDDDRYISKQMYEYVQNIPIAQERGSRSALTVIDLLLNNIQGTSSRQELEALSMKRCIESALEEYPFKIEAERDLVEWNQQSNFIFKGNEDLTKYLLFNLIKNSLHYIKVARKGKIKIWIQEGNGCNYLYFEDTAEGIEKEKLKNVFKNFYSKRKGGTGLGLAFCKEAVEKFGGSITCQSVKGEYIRFIMSFPIVLPPYAQRASEGKSALYSQPC